MQRQVDLGDYFWHFSLTFAAINRFCFVISIYNPPTPNPLFLMDNIKLNGIETKIK